MIVAIWIVLIIVAAVRIEIYYGEYNCFLKIVATLSPITALQIALVKHVQVLENQGNFITNVGKYIIISFDSNYESTFHL